MWQLLPCENILFLYSVLKVFRIPQGTAAIMDSECRISSSWFLAGVSIHCEMGRHVWDNTNIKELRTLWYHYMELSMTISRYFVSDRFFFFFRIYFQRIKHTKLLSHQLNVWHLSDQIQFMHYEIFMWKNYMHL